MAKEEVKAAAPPKDPELSEKDQASETKGAKNKNEKKDKEEDELVWSPQISLALFSILFNLYL